VANSSAEQGQKPVKQALPIRPGSVAIQDDRDIDVAAGPYVSLCGGAEKIRRDDLAFPRKHGLKERNQIVRFWFAGGCAARFDNQIDPLQWRQLVWAYYSFSRDDLAWTYQR